MPLDKAKQLGAMALFSEKYGDTVRVVKIGKSIELCGGTHATNTKDIKRLAITSCESKGSNVYRIEAVTGDRIEEALYNIIQPYTDEKIRLLMKAKEILEEARNNGLKLEFEVDINNDQPTSYKDIIFNKNELQYVHQEEKELEKKYYELKEKSTLQNLDIYREHIKVIKDIETIMMTVNNKDTNILKSIADSLMNEMKNGFIFFINQKDDGSMNFIAKSNSDINAGYIMKKITEFASGKGGGSPTFAQGGTSSLEDADELLKQVVKEIKND
jgi:alanyl-tRNA synthetase